MNSQDKGHIAVDERYLEEIEKLNTVRTRKRSIKNLLKRYKGWIVLYILMAVFLGFISGVGIIRTLIGTFILWAVVVLIAKCDEAIEDWSEEEKESYLAWNMFYNPFTKVDREDSPPSNILED